MNKVKKPYADMDPIEEIRAVREELSREFPTAKALREYLWEHYPSSRPTPEPQPEPLRKGRRSSAKAKARPNTRPALRQRKSAVPA